MNGGWVRLLAIGCAVGALMLINGISELAIRPVTPPPAGESNSDHASQQAAATAQPAVSSAARQISDEGDRAAREGRFREAIDYYSAALALAPSDTTLYGRRSAMYQRVGESTLADRDRQCIAVLAEYSKPQSPITIDLLLGDGLSISTPQDALAWGAGAWLLLTLCYCWIGYRQSREGGGTIRRLIGVAGGAALVALLPLFVWMVVQLLHPVGFVETTEALLLTALSSFWMALVLRPPLRPYPSRPPLPLVEDETVLERVNNLAKAMGIAPPRVRLVRSVGGAQRVLAWAGGLPKPIVIVTDGLLSRLDGTERDAVIAHEMGHIANHSLWPLSSLFSISCGVAALVAIWYPFGFAMAFGFAFLMGLKRIVSRPIEADCDRRAARAIGYSNTITALAKVHALHPVRSTGWLSLVGYAWATHPSPDVRLSVLRRAQWSQDAHAAPTAFATGADADEKHGGELHLNARRFRLHRAVSWLGVLLWTGALCLGLRLASVSENVALGLLVSVALIPTLLLSFAQTAAARRARARQRLRPVWLGFAILIAVGALVYAPFFIDNAFSPDHFGVALFLPVVVAIVLTSVLASSRRGQNFRSQIAEAMQDHRFEEILEIGRKNRKQIARIPSIRYSVAFIEALRGDRAFAISELEELRRKHRSFALPSLTLWALYYDAGELETALEVAQSAARRWPKDPEFLLCDAMILRRLGRLDEAEALTDAALAIDRNVGHSYAVAAEIALDRGDVSTAQRLVERAIELEPGGLLALIVQAEIAIAGGDREQSRAAIDRAVKTIKSNPFALCDADIARLEERFAELDAEKVAG